MANEQNLKPFKKGQSGNPKGRPRTRPLQNALLQALCEESDGPAQLEQIAKKLIEEAKRGNMAAIKFLFERLEGPPCTSLPMELAKALKKGKSSEAHRIIKNAVLNDEIDLETANKVGEFLTVNRKNISNEKSNERFPFFSDED